LAKPQRRRFHQLSQQGRRSVRTKYWIDLSTLSRLICRGYNRNTEADNRIKNALPRPDSPCRRTREHELVPGEKPLTTTPCYYH
jgi:hypothetical protein